MRKTIGLALSVIAVTAFAQSASTTRASDTPAHVPVKNFDVFVDLPTGYTFVKLPAGWKFVGKVEQEQLGNLPSTVHTSLLSHSSNDDIEIARSELAAAK